jgi:peptidyl-prolyl cis-trans isomerase D
VRFAALEPAQRIPDDSVTVAPAEIEAYWKSHQDDFKVPNRATVKVLSLSKIPTPADTAAALARATAIVAELRAGASIDTVGDREAAATPPATFQDLGTFTRGQMVGAFDTAAFSAPVGRAEGPVKTEFGYHAFVVSKRSGDSATAKHILIPITRTAESDDALFSLADSMETLAEGHKLDEVAATMGLQTSTTELNDAFPFLAGVGAANEASDWAFQDGQVGDVSEVFENDQSFYVVELLSKKPGGILPLDEATPTVQTVLRLQKKIDKAKAQGADLVAKIKGGAGFTDAVTAAGFEVSTPGPFTRTDFVPLLGQMNAAIGAAFGLPTGKVSDPIATSDDVYVMEKLGSTPADSTAWLGQKVEQRKALMSLLQQQRLQQWIAGLRDAAKIVDRRAEVLKPAADTATAGNLYNNPTGRFGY